MNESRIVPDKVTKPIQLLAAWLVGLILVNGSFLLGAQQITRPEWASSLLVIASVFNVPVFIGALFLLQTKFRPQMQEDSYYSQYLENERLYGSQTLTETGGELEVVEQEIAQTTEKLVKSLGAAGKGKEKPIGDILRESQVELLATRLGGSRALAELYLSPGTWSALVNRWGRSESFIRDIERLLSEGIVDKKYKGYRNCKLTDLGKQVAQMAEKDGLLISQKRPEFWERQRASLEEDA